MRAIKNDPALVVGAAPVTDGSQIYYYGISDGGIQGGTYMGLSEDVTRGALNVPGSEWSLLIQRSTDFANLQQILDIEYADPLDQQLLLALIQPEWDFTDPIGFAPHLIASPLPSTPAKRILVQEAIHDAQVTNLSTLDWTTTPASRDIVPVAASIGTLSRIARRASGKRDHRPRTVT